MKVACPWCNEVKDVTGMLPDTVVQCTCGQTFRVPEPVTPPTATPVEEPELSPANDVGLAPAPEQPPIPTPAQPVQPVQPVQTTKPTPGTAIASLILGLLSFATCGIFMAIPGLILGYSGRKQIDNDPSGFGGRGVAIAGIVINWICIIISVIGISVVVLLAIIGSL